jgi:hypothetical protein
MTKSEDIMKSLNEEELKILLLCFSKPKVVEALRIYHKIPGHGKQVFYDAGKKQMFEKRILHHKQLLLDFGDLE